MSGALDHLSDREKYLIALGIFVEKFAVCESLLLIVLAKITGLSDETSRAILSGVRSDTARTYIKRIFDARGEDLPENLTRAFNQLGVISTARNDLMHYGAQVVNNDVSNLYVSNDVVSMPGRERKTPISAEIITNMIGDLDTITASLGLFHFTYHGTPVELVGNWNAGAHRAWLYKSPPQAALRPKSQPPRQERKAPRSSSEG